MKKTYRLLADSRQLKKSKGETVELPPAAAKYLVAASVIEEVAEIQPRELLVGEAGNHDELRAAPAGGEILQAAELPPGSAAIDLGVGEVPAKRKR